MKLIEKYAMTKSFINPDFSSGFPSDPDVVEAGKRTSADLVATQVAWQILTQKYAPGGRLREQELSKEYDVSRTVIRDVIGKLAARGFVEIHPWRGATIVNFTTDELADLLEFNALAYGLVGRLAAERRATEDLAGMEAALADMKQLATSCSSPEEFHIPRVDFYTVLNRATGSFLSGRRRASFPLTFYHQSVLADIQTVEARLAQVAFFDELLQHIAAQDGPAAAYCAQANFMEKRAIVLDSLKAEALA